MDELIHDLNEKENNGILTSKQRNKLILYIFICMFINLILNHFMTTGHAVNLDGQIATKNEIDSATIYSILIYFPILGFIISSLISLFPYKNLPFTKKYLRFSLLTILIIEIIVFILIALSLIIQNQII